MILRKLIPMTDYVNQILAYVNESKNHERGIELIKWYSELINQPLKIELFQGEEPLFPSFVTENQSIAISNKRKKSIWLFGLDDLGEKEYAVTAYKGNGYYSKYHLKKVEDLCEMELDFNLQSEFCETDLFD